MDANSFFEYLIPALFFVFYIITKILEARTKKASPRDIPEGAEPSTVDDVRRDIQKKILERKQQRSARDLPEMDWAHEPKMSMRPQPSKARPTTQAVPPQEGYLLRLKKEKLRLEAARKEAQKAREKAQKKQAAPKRTSQRAYPTLQETLRNPAQARKAYLYHEIFGAPIALRRREGMFPSWKN